MLNQFRFHAKVVQARFDESSKGCSVNTGWKRNAMNPLSGIQDASAGSCHHIEIQRHDAEHA